LTPLLEKVVRLADESGSEELKTEVRGHLLRIAQAHTEETDPRLRTVRR
jgi:hypothetical protein